MKRCPDCDEPMIEIEYAWDSPEHYDGASEYLCRKCRIRIGRWSGKRLADGEPELRSAMYASGK